MSRLLHYEFLLHFSYYIMSPYYIMSRYYIMSCYTPLNLRAEAVPFSEDCWAGGVGLKLYVVLLGALAGESVGYDSSENKERCVGRNQLA